jgi:Putative auto-transporter adhesin, head GIN domain
MAGLGRMGRSASGILAILLLFGSAAQAQVNKAIERKLLVGSFENIVVIGDISVTIVTGKAPSAFASGDKRMLESLKLERVGTTLRVRLQDIVNNDRGAPITAPMRVTLTTQEIKDVTLSGNGTVTISEVKQANLVRMLLAGNGTINIGKLVTDQYSAAINGNGKIELGAGTVRDAKVIIEGAGVFQGEKVRTRKLRLEHVGNAISTATVEEGTDIYNRGSGNITIGGKGTCFLKQAGAASINCAKLDTGSSK